MGYPLAALGGEAVVARASARGGDAVVVRSFPLRFLRPGADIEGMKGARVLPSLLRSVRRAASWPRWRSRPRSLLVEVTQRCNLDCRRTAAC